jgi:hypothetical protein
VTTEPDLSVVAIADTLGVSPEALGAWLAFGRQLGVRFELLSPLLELAYAQLAEAPARPSPEP